jgi:hypothetical protein
MGERQLRVSLAVEYAERAGYAKPPGARGEEKSMRCAEG